MRFRCPARYLVPSRPSPLPGTMEAEEFRGLLNLPASKRFSSEQEMLDYVATLTLFTVVGSPEVEDPGHPGFSASYNFHVRRVTDGAQGTLLFISIAGGGFKYAGIQIPGD